MVSYSCFAKKNWSCSIHRIFTIAYRVVFVESLLLCSRRFNKDPVYIRGWFTMVHDLMGSQPTPPKVAPKK